MISMMDEWKKDRLRTEPKDAVKYRICQGVITATERVLREYGSRKPSCEGLVYWGGIKNEAAIMITTCIAPLIKASRYNIGIDHFANYKVVEALSANNIVHIAQVHSHPGKWVDHSDTDDEYASFKRDGLLSLVVPLFCEEGMLPLKRCGIHRFIGTEFKRLTDSYVKAHFEIIPGDAGKFIELRNENE